MNTVLNYLKSKSLNNTLSFKDLTLKLVTLLALGTGQQMKTLASIKLPKNWNNREGIMINITDIIKISRPGKEQLLLNLPHFTECPELYMASCLNAYIKVTEPLRSQSSSFLISYVKPHRAVEAQSLSS